MDANTMSPSLQVRAAGRVQRGQGGFTLVELMVGVLLGLVTVAMIAQVYALSESRKQIGRASCRERV